MLTKLTFEMDEALARQAESYARRRGKSLSQVVADYFARLEDEEMPDDLPPITRSLLGCIPSDTVKVSDYKAYIEEKYQ